MRIEELEDGDAGDAAGGGGEGGGEEERSIVSAASAKRAAVGVGARVLFYPTLLYNVIRNKVQTEFRWWDEVHEFVLLGAVPFPSDVPRLKQLGVCGVITLNEPYETLVPTSLYSVHGIDHLMIPTRDYLFAPSFGDICQAVNFIHNNASCGKTTYVHCKAGRGRSTTIVLCYLVQHKKMTPSAAYEYVKATRPRVLLAEAQWQAVEDYYLRRVEKTGTLSCLDKNPVDKTLASVTTQRAIDDGSFVVVTESDLDGYVGNHTVSVYTRSHIWAELRIVYRVHFAGQAALEKLSCVWLSCHALLPDKKAGAGRLLL